MSELVQEEKYEELTTQEKIACDPLDQFMPKWSAYVLDDDKSLQHEITFTDTSKCLVGEAHGMSCNYNREDQLFLNQLFHINNQCHFCEYMSFGHHKKEGKLKGWGNKRGVNASENKDLFVEFKKTMYKHMKKKHPKKFKKLGYK